jgi:hypothetical protein
VPDGKLARVDNTARPSDVIDYLSGLPRFYAIALYPTGDDTWLVAPYSIADAEQRGWIGGMPREVYLTRMQVEPLDVLVTRSMAGTLIFDDIDTRLGAHAVTVRLRETLAGKSHPIPDRSWSNALDIVSARLRKLVEEQQRADLEQRIREQKLSTEEAIRFQLEFMGAALRNIERLGDHYSVEWTAPDGHTYTMQVGQNLRVEVAGLCLNNSDRFHNLSSIVKVIEEATRLRRPDLPGRDYDLQEDYDDD